MVKKRLLTLLLFSLILLIVLISSSIWTDDLEENLILYYGLEDTSGTNVVDAGSIGSGISSEVVHGVEGKVNNAYTFNGVNSTINSTMDTNSLGIDLANSNVSGFAWVNIDSIATNNIIFTQSDGVTSTGWSFGIDSTGNLIYSSAAVGSWSSD